MTFKNKRALFTRVAIAMTIIVSAVAARYSGLLAKAGSVPTAEVKRGEFVEYLQIRGEIRAVKSTILTAPSSSGDLLIVKLQRTGSHVQSGDAIVEFDPSTLQRTLEQKENDLKSANAQIQQQVAQGSLTEEQNITDSLNARYNVERAQLEAGKQEILSEIDGAKSNLALADSKKQQEQAEIKVKTGRMGVEADVEMRKAKRDKAQFDVALVKRQLASLVMRSPADGVVTLMPNFRASNFGSNAPEFKQGDRAWSGAAIAEIPDLSSIRFEARIDEADRGNLKEGQIGTIRVDAVPDREFNAHIHTISTLAKLDFTGWPPSKNFAIDIQIEDNDPRIRPGMSASCRVAIQSAKDSILVPIEGVFQKNGRNVLYVQKGGRFDERLVWIDRKNATHAQIIRGVEPGERVALKDPTVTGNPGSTQ